MFPEDEFSERFDLPKLEFTAKKSFWGNLDFRKGQPVYKEPKAFFALSPEAQKFDIATDVAYATLRKDSTARYLIPTIISMIAIFAIIILGLILSPKLYIVLLGLYFIFLSYLLFRPQQKNLLAKRDYTILLAFALTNNREAAIEALSANVRRYFHGEKAQKTIDELIRLIDSPPSIDGFPELNDTLQKNLKLLQDSKPR